MWHSKKIKELEARIELLEKAFGLKERPWSARSLFFKYEESYLSKWEALLDFLELDWKEETLESKFVKKKPKKDV